MNPTSEKARRIPAHSVVSREAWLARRRELLRKEKELTRLRDELSAERRALPWVRVDQDYRFETGQGQVSLGDLFAGRSQLAIYHFMFGPEWQEGCPSCSFVSDHLDGALEHLAARDVTLTMVSRAPIARIKAFQQRLGWRFPWVSSFGTDFNYDYHVSFSPEQIAQGGGKVDYNYALEEFPSEEAPGLSVFYRHPESGEIFHTYSVYARGLEPFIGTYMLLDLVPKGRDEDDLDFSMAWLRYHDRYGADGASGFADAGKPYWPENPSPVAPEAGDSSCCSKAGGAKG